MRANVYPKVEGRSFRLRALEHSDVEQWFRYLTLPNVLSHTSWNLTSMDELHLLVDEYNATSAFSQIRFAIEREGSDELLGTIGFHSISPIHRTAEIAYDIHPQFWGQGIATSCCNSVVEWGLSQQDYFRIQALALDTNYASTQVLKKCGFLREGTLRHFRLVRGEPRDFAIFSKIAV